MTKFSRERNIVGNIIKFKDQLDTKNRVTLGFRLGAGCKPRYFMVKSCIDDYSTQNNLIHWWQNIFCLHNIHEKATLPKHLQKMIRFVFF